MPLFGGAESPDAVRLRKELFESAWPVLEDRIHVSQDSIQLGLMLFCLAANPLADTHQHVLREANRSTLDEVTSFLQEAPRAEETYVANARLNQPANGS